MKDSIIHIIVPLVFSNTLHMLIVKANFLSGLNSPISTSLFGKNKTWRGFLVVPVLNAVTLIAICTFTLFFSFQNALVWGACLGFTYVFFELPNSFIKRKTGVLPGEKSLKIPWLFSILDKTDSAFGISLVGTFILSLDFWFFLQLFAVAVFTHVFFSFLLLIVGIKKSF